MQLGEEKLLFLTPEVMQRKSDIDDVVVSREGGETHHEIPHLQGTGHPQFTDIFLRESEGDWGEIDPGIGGDGTSPEKTGTELCIPAAEIQKRKWSSESIQPAGKDLSHGSVVEIVIVHNPAVKRPLVEKLPDRTGITGFFHPYPFIEEFLKHS